MNLNNLKIGQSAIITKVDDKIYGIQRIKELGFSVGVIVKMVGRSPFNDPLIVNVRGSDFCIRINLAKKIEVKVIEKDLPNRKS